MPAEGVFWRRKEDFHKNDLFDKKLNLKNTSNRLMILFDEERAILGEQAKETGAARSSLQPQQQRLLLQIALQSEIVLEAL